jgi:hypothetical protein
MNDTFADILDPIFDLIIIQTHHNKNKTRPKYTPYHRPSSPLILNMTYIIYLLQHETTVSTDSTTLREGHHEDGALPCNKPHNTQVSTENQTKREYIHTYIHT